jgi:hypothetical protein
LNNKYKAGGVFTEQELQGAAAQAQRAVNEAKKLPSLYDQVRFQNFGYLINTVNGYIISGDMEQATKALGPAGPQIIRQIQSIKSRL